MVGVNATEHSTPEQQIAQIIAATPQRRVTFAQFMDLALYHPQYGYYANRAVSIGPRGDFFTSPHLGPDFGELLAEQFVQMWEVMHRPVPFTLVEMGAGQGLLAMDVLRHLTTRFPEFCQGLRYVIVERAVPLIAAQQQQLQPFIEIGVSVCWQPLTDIALNSVVGCLFSNELVDALPVHRVVVESGHLREIYVSVDAAGAEANSNLFVEIADDLSTPELADYFNGVGVDICSSSFPDRYHTEVNLAALEWVGTVADRLQRGFLLTIDYGYSSDRYYNPKRSQGTLQCYYQHAHHNDPYRHVGDQDITAHVDFTALQRWGDRHGLTTLGLTQQGLFLLALGLGDRIAALGQSTATDPQAIHAILRRREALHQLVNPLGLGNFGVLIQAKGCTATLRGLTPT
jgi:SAM-dependent MidA family methyltransferase